MAAVGKKTTQQSQRWVATVPHERQQRLQPTAALRSSGLALLDMHGCCQWLLPWFLLLLQDCLHRMALAILRSHLHGGELESKWSWPCPGTKCTTLVVHFLLHLRFIDTRVMKTERKRGGKNELLKSLARIYL